jgi:hypothetical protein
VNISTALLTIIGSGVVAAWISHHLAKGKEELFYKRKKLEELYKSIVRYTTTLFSMNFMWPRVMDGKLSFNEGLDLLVRRRDDDEKHHLPEIDMLINLYFHNFLTTYTNFINKRDVINDLYDDFKSIYEVKGPTIDYSNNKKEFVKALLELEEVSKVLLEEVAQYAQKLK